MPCAILAMCLAPTSAHATLIEVPLECYAFLAERWGGVASPNLPHFMLLYDTGRQTDLSSGPGSSF